eukprot:TRINITY_DN10954_c1_g1_i2.p1 TRINITY_DN10954_c1_g1~~TRINITY_DN10954_c1_g1_i2.p1  ORF type:complete len:273 (+),score=63.22 TRINITY_DN10954_c1_g1_i2:28-846(+)
MLLKVVTSSGKHARCFTSSCPMLSGKAWDVPHLAAGSIKPDIDPDQVYLYNMRFCPYAERAVLALMAKNVPFHNININLNFRQNQKPEWFLAETFGQVPVILYKGAIIPESLIVCDFIDEAFPGTSLHPTDPVQKAKDRVLLEIFDRIRKPFFKILWSKDEESSERLEAFKELNKKLKPIELEYKIRGTTFFGGQTPGMLDWLMWPWFERMPVLEKYGLVQPDLPGLQPYIQAMWNTDPVKQYGLNTEEHFKFLDQFSHRKEIDYDFLIPKN